MPTYTTRMSCDTDAPQPLHARVPLASPLFFSGRWCFSTCSGSQQRQTCPCAQAVESLALNCCRFASLAAHAPAPIQGLCLRLWSEHCFELLLLYVTGRASPCTQDFQSRLWSEPRFDCCLCASPVTRITLCAGCGVEVRKRRGPQPRCRRRCNHPAAPPLQLQPEAHERAAARCGLQARGRAALRGGHEGRAGGHQEVPW